MKPASPAVLTEESGGGNPPVFLLGRVFRGRVPCAETFPRKTKRGPPCEKHGGPLDCRLKLPRTIGSGNGQNIHSRNRGSVPKPVFGFSSFTPVEVPVEVPVDPVAPVSGFTVIGVEEVVDSVASFEEET